MPYKKGDVVVWHGEDGYGSQWKLVTGKGDQWTGKYVGGMKPKMTLKLGDVWALTSLADPRWADEFENFVCQTREEANCS